MISIAPVTGVLGSWAHKAVGWAGLQETAQASEVTKPILWGVVATFQLPSGAQDSS